MHVGLIHLEFCKRLKKKKERKVTFKYYSCTNGQKCSRRNINIDNSNTLKELHLQAKSSFALNKADNERK